MFVFEIVSEIYKFRLGALEYDGLALAQSLRNKENGGDKKKKDNAIASGQETAEVAELIKRPREYQARARALHVARRGTRARQTGTVPPA